MPIHADAVISVTPDLSQGCRLSWAAAVVPRCGGSGSRSGGPGSACATTWRARPGPAWSRWPATWSACTRPTRRRSTWPPGPGRSPGGRGRGAGPVRGPGAGPDPRHAPDDVRRAGRARGRVVQAACTDAIATQQRRLLVDLVGRAGLADDPPGWIEEVEKAPSGRWRPAAGRPPPSWPRTTPASPSRSCSPRASRTRAARAWSPASCCCWPPRAGSSAAALAGPGSAASTAGRWLTTGCPTASHPGHSRRPRPSWSGAGCGVRPGHDRRREVVDRLDPWARAPGRGRDRRGRGRPGRHGRGAPWRTTSTRSAPRSRGRHCCRSSTRPRWAGRTASWYLGAHGRALFDPTATPGRPCGADGRIVGGWAQRATGEVVLRFLEDVGDGARTRREAGRPAQEWLARPGSPPGSARRWSGS